MPYVDHSEYRVPVTGRPRQAPRAVVTGAAGFIGSHLADLLLARGHDVIGLDSFDPASSPDRRARNLAGALGRSSFRLEVADVRTAALHELFRDADTVYHLAARAGVQDSWGPAGASTWSNNAAATQAVLEAALAAGVRRVVLASSSSVYGDTAQPGGPRVVAPASPYGASKAACEHLAGVYAGRGLEIVTLRYFTVFGPRQRPDMAMQRMFEAAAGGAAFARRGRGSQTREFTFVRDVAEATAAAGTAHEAVGRALDIGGGLQASLNEVIAAVEEIVGDTVPVRPVPRPAGDPRATVASRGPARRVLGWKPRTSLRQGLAEQWAWHLGLAQSDQHATGTTPAPVVATADPRRSRRARVLAAT